MVLIFAVGSNSYANISKVVVSSGANNYQYDMSSLENSYLAYQIMPDSPATLLYLDYKDKTPIAFYDDIRMAYVDFSDIESAYLVSQITGQVFDPDEYSETDAKTAPGTVQQNLNDVMVENGQIVTVPVSADTEDFEIIGIE